MSDCGHVYKNGCYSCLETKIDKIENKIDKLLMYKTSEAGYKDGYEKGVRDMWEVTKKHCEFKLVKYKETDDNGESFNAVEKTYCNEGNGKKCTFKTCPIAQKLSKGVK